jgi:hypothetical protein
MTKKPLFNLTKHKKKVLAVGIIAVMFIWNFIIVPIAAFYGLTLPLITIEHLRTAATILLGF